MKTTDELVQSMLGDVNVKIPELISMLHKNITNKNSEVKDILDIAKNLKSTMESFAKSIDQIKNLSEYVEVSKETNLRLEEISTQIENSMSIVVALNDKINKTKENIGKKTNQEKLMEAVGDRETYSSKKSNPLTNILFIVIGTTLSNIGILILAYSFFK